MQKKILNAACDLLDQGKLTPRQFSKIVAQFGD